MKRVSTISNIDCVMPQVNSRWRCSNRCEAAKSWVEYPDHIFVDRIDIQTEITPVPFKDISKTAQGEPSSAIRERVIAARRIQEERFRPYKGVHCNAQMSERMIHSFAEPDTEGVALLRTAMERLSLSARAYNRILKVARTIADLAASERVMPEHLAEAISYRNLDRGDWAERGFN